MKKITRLLSVMMAVVIGVLTATGTASQVTGVAMAAEENVALRLTTDASQIKPGDTLTVTMELERNSGLSGLTARWHYDTEVLSLVSVSQAQGSSYSTAVLFPVKELLTDQTVSLDEAAAGTVGFSYGEAATKTATGSLLVATFSVKADAKPGDSTIAFTYTDASDFNAKTLSVKTENVTFEVAMPVTVLADSDSAEDQAAAMEVTELVQKLMKGGEVKEIEETLAGELRDAVTLQKTIRVAVKKSALEETALPEEEKELIAGELSETQTIAGYYDIQLQVKIDDQVKGTLDQLSKAVSLSVDMPEGLPEVEEGKFRKFSIIRVFNGKAEVLNATAAADAIGFMTAGFGTFGVVYEEADGILGDVNGDGSADIADALMISRYDAGLTDLNDSQLAVGDVNGDGEVNIADALMISRYDAGLITSL